MDAVYKLYLDNKIKQSEWRISLINQMNVLESSGVNCLSCSGHCCTQKRNSMQITLAEGIAVYFDLKDKKLFDDHLKCKLQKCIEDSRLDQIIYIKNKALRRNYTCPLFELKGFGCPLDKGNKPFGCLGYNARSPNETEGESCRSEIEILESTEDKFLNQIAELSKRISETLQLPLDKMTIPQMLLLIDSRMNSGPQS